MEKSPQNESPSSTPRPSFFQVINLMKKPYFVQYIILGLWTAAAILVLYYSIYVSSTLDLVKVGILPSDVSWAWKTAVGLTCGGIVLLFLPADKNNIIRDQLKLKTPTIIADAEALILQHDFGKAIDVLSNHFEQLKKLQVKEGVDKMLDLTRRARINKNVAATLDQFQTDIDTKEKRLFQQAFLKFQADAMAQREFILTNLLERIQKMYGALFYS